MNETSQARKAILLQKFLFAFIIAFFANLNIVNGQQYNVAGNAFWNGNPGCYTLTNTTGQSGAVWNVNTIDLTQPIDITLTLNFGCNDADNYPDPNCGADGISFVLQPNGTGSFGSGGGVGFNGIFPSFGVVMDTYTNGPDDNFAYDGGVDHISININGNVTHGTANELVPPSVGAASGFPTNIEDCNDHIFRFIWEPDPVLGGTAVVYFDGIPMLSYTGDIVTNVFNGNPVVYWGVSASTGGCWNVQTVCMTVVASFTTTGSYCKGSPIQFQDQSISGTTINSWNWDFGDGTTSNQQNPVHTYDAPGDYQVVMSITNISGFSSTITQEISILAPIVSIDSVGPVCEGDMITLNGHATPFPPTMIQTSSFSNTNAMPIPDGGIGTSWSGTGGNFATSNIAVTGLTTGWSIESVCLNITHSYDGDLIIYLKDPCGNLMLLSRSNGSSGDNYTNTCFSPAANASITTGFPPFSGTWIPQAGAAAWNTLTSCANPNGNWSLLIGDTYSSDNGSLNNWSITFVNQIPVTVNYIWQPLNVSTTLTPSFNATNSEWIHLSASDNLGCSDMDSVYLTVNPVPIISIIGDTICPGEQATITASGAQNYLWNTSATINPLVVSPSATTTYTVTGTSNNCSSSASAQVIVNPSLTITLVGDTICEGEHSILNPSGADAYLWNSGSTDNPYEVQPSTTTTYSVTGTNISGCSGTASAQVLVRPNPSITITAPAVCEGTSGTITASGAASYNWSNGSTNNPLVLQPAVAGTYTVTGTTLGCIGTASATLTVNPLPIPQFVSSATKGCAPLEINFTDQSTGNITQWQWRTTSGIFSVNQNPTHTFSQAGTYPITLTVTTDEGCTASITPINIFVSQVIANIITNSHVSQAGDNINFFDGSMGASSWQWDFGNGEQSNLQHPGTMYDQPGEYTVVLTVQNQEGCTDSDSTLLDIRPLFTIYIPSAFSPNDDGINDLWYPYGESWNINQYEIEIFDRWGNMVFHSTDINTPWEGPEYSGTNSTQSVYSYRIKITDTNGITHIYSGGITVFQ